MREFRAIFRLEATAVLRARWLAAAAVLACGVVGFFVVVTAHESALFGFTGYGRILAGTVQVALLFQSLLAVFATAQSITDARQRGVLEWYLGFPVSRPQCFWAIFLPRLGAVLAPIVIAIALLATIAAWVAEPIPLARIALFELVLIGQTACFAAIGSWISVVSRSPEQALLRSLGAWLAAAILVDFVFLAVMLRWEVPAGLVFGLAVLNPLQAGRVATIAATAPQLDVLGPVGTWALVNLGAPATMTWGLIWPLLLGGIVLALAARSFSRRDVL